MYHFEKRLSVQSGCNITKAVVYVQHLAEKNIRPSLIAGFRILRLHTALWPRHHPNQ